MVNIPDPDEFATGFPDWVPHRPPRPDKSQGGIDAQACGGDEECHIERAGLCLPANVVTRAAGR